MVGERDPKVSRILTMYLKLQSGEVLSKKELANIFKVNEKTIQRDLDDIRFYLSENRASLGDREVIYTHNKKGYVLTNRGEILGSVDILAIIKILLESRAFCKEEMKHLTTSILGQVELAERRKIKDLISNEQFNYVPLNHGELLLDKIWDLSEYIRNKEITEIVYIKSDGSKVIRIIKPIAIIFSEYYFYLIAYFNDFDSPTVFRIDRIKAYKKIGEKFYISNSERFEDGEFRKRVQFMYQGKLMKIKFQFNSYSIDAVLDRLPTAKILEETGEGFLVEAEIYGKGIIMWILSQGKKIKVLSPSYFVEEVKKEIENMKNNYL